MRRSWVVLKLRLGLPPKTPVLKTAIKAERVAFDLVDDHETREFQGSPAPVAGLGSPFFHHSQNVTSPGDKPKLDLTDAAMPRMPMIRATTLRYGPSTAREGHGPTTAWAGPSQGPFLANRKQTSGGRHQPLTPPRCDGPRRFANASSAIAMPACRRLPRTPLARRAARPTPLPTRTNATMAGKTRRRSKSPAAIAPATRPVRAGPGISGMTHPSGAAGARAPGAARPARPGPGAATAARQGLPFIHEDTTPPSAEPRPIPSRAPAAVSAVRLCSSSPIAPATDSGGFQVKEGDVHGTGDGGHPVVIAGQCDRLAQVAQVFAGRQM